MAMKGLINLWKKTIYGKLKFKKLKKIQNLGSRKDLSLQW